MILRSVVRDCLYLNWALPAEDLPPPPSSLRYEVHPWEGRRVVFASALLFRHDRLRLATLPGIRLSYPQFNLRLYALDGDGVPSVLFVCILTPFWVVPAARLVARQRVRRASFGYPSPSRVPGEDGWRWQVRRGRRLEVLARQGSPAVGEGPSLGSWEATVSYFRERPRGYASGGGGRLRRIETSHPPADVWPLRAEILEDGLLPACLAGAPPVWPGLHSAWLCPELPFVFELAEDRKGALPSQVPAPG